MKVKHLLDSELYPILESNNINCSDPCAGDAYLSLVGWVSCPLVVVLVSLLSIWVWCRRPLQQT